MPVGFQSERRARVPVLQGVQQVARQPAGSDDSRRTKAGPTILSAPRSTNGRESTHGPQRKGANRTCCIEFRQAARSAIRWASFQLAMCLEAVSPCRTGPTSIAVLRFDRRTTRLSGAMNGRRSTPPRRIAAPKTAAWPGPLEPLVGLASFYCVSSSSAGISFRDRTKFSLLGRNTCHQIAVIIAEVM